MRVLFILLIPWFVMRCGNDTTLDSDVSTEGSAATRLSEETPDPNLSIQEKIARYPTANGFGLIDDRFLWMQRIELVAGLRYVENRIKDAPIIAILDSGIDYLHPALQQNIYQKPAGLKSHCPGDIYGCDTSEYATGDRKLGTGQIYPVGTNGPDQYCRTNRDGFQSIECSHGTHVAGVIAGFNEDKSIFGICPHCRILAVKVVGRDGTITDQAIIGALQYIAELRRGGVPIRIINSSFGKFLSSKRVAAAMAGLPEFSKEVLIVAAAGNENTELRTYPASFENVIAVANVNSSNLKKDAKSNFGRWVDIAAPVGNCYPGFSSSNGFGIVSAIPGKASRCANGTSVAAPQVAAVAGLILSMEPDLSITELRNRILRTADAKTLYRNNPDYLETVRGDMRALLGSGLLNVSNALKDENTGLLLNNKSHKRIVPPFCGVLGLPGSGETRFLILILILAPLCSLPLWRKKEGHT